MTATPPTTHDDGDRRAWLDVKKGRRFTGARVPGEVDVVDGELRFTIVERRHGRKERQAVGRLSDEKALARMLGPEPLVIRIALDRVSLRYPAVPMLGRSVIVVSWEDNPDLVITFLHLGDPLRTTPYQLLWRALVRGPAARRRRDALRAEIERATAG